MNIMQYRYADECMYKAAFALATGQGKLKDRIVDAYIYHLSVLEPSWFPEHLQKQFTDIKDKLTKNGTKTVRESIHFWKKSKTSSIAGDIFELFRRLEYFYRSDGKTQY